MPTLAGDVQTVLADGRCCSRTRRSPSSSPTDRYAAADGVELVEVEYEELPVHRRSLQGDGAGRAGAARGHQGQDRTARTAPRKHHNHIFTWEVGDKDGDRRGVRARPT